MNPNTRVAVLVVLVVILAGGVTWEITHHKDAPSKGPAAVASAHRESESQVATAAPPPRSKPSPRVPAGDDGLSTGGGGGVGGGGGGRNRDDDAQAASAPPPAASAAPADGSPGGSGGPYTDPLPVAQLVKNAQAALVRGDLISPEDNSALYWARRARRVNPQNTAAIQIEETILLGSIRLIQADRKAGRYNSALQRLDTMQTLFPDRVELWRLRSDIEGEMRRQGPQR